MSTTTDQQKITITNQVATFELQTLASREHLYQPMVNALNSLEPWSDEPALWVKWSGLGGYWDTWRNLRYRLDAATPSKSGAIAKTEPHSAAAGAASGFVEGAGDGAQNIADVATDLANGAKRGLRAVADVAANSNILIYLTVGLLVWWGYNKAKKG